MVAEGQPLLGLEQVHEIQAQVQLQVLELLLQVLELAPEQVLEPVLWQQAQELELLLSVLGLFLLVA
jgi:hypothetical protein